MGREKRTQGSEVRDQSRTRAPCITVYCRAFGHDTARWRCAKVRRSHRDREGDASRASGPKLNRERRQLRPDWMTFSPIKSRTSFRHQAATFDQRSTTPPYSKNPVNSSERWSEKQLTRQEKRQLGVRSASGQCVLHRGSGIFARRPIESRGN